MKYATGRFVPWYNLCLHLGVSIEPLQIKLMVSFSSSSTLPSVLPDTSTANAAKMSKKAVSSSSLGGLLSGSPIGLEDTPDSAGRFKGDSVGTESISCELVAISFVAASDVVDKFSGACEAEESCLVDGPA